jgi:hypothetical protein
MTNALKLVVSCESFGLEKNFKDLFWPCFSKAYQYGTTNEKVCRNLKYISIKFAQVDIQKCITWPKNLGRVGMSGKKLLTKLVYTQRN